MSNSQDRFSVVRLLTCGGIAFLLLGLFLTSSAQADLISAVRVNALDGWTFNNLYTNADFSIGNSSNQYCTQQSNGNNAYIFTKTVDGVVHDYSPVVLCDLGVVHTINSIDVSAYSVGINSVKGIKVEFYDTPSLSGTPVHTQEFTVNKTGTTTLTLSKSVQARYAKFTMTSNNNGDRVGVGDVMFNVESYLKTPTSASMNDSEVQTRTGYSVNYLYEMDAKKQWCSENSDATNGYFNGSNANPVFTFNYDAPVTLSSVFIQTYSENGSSLKDFQLEFFDKDGNQIALSSENGSKYNFTMTDCNYGIQNGFSFPEVENVSSVKMTVTSNFKGIVPANGDRIGVGGVYFSNLELDFPTTPEKYGGSLRADNILVRPTEATFVTEGSARASGCSVSFLFDGSGTGCGKDAWYTNRYSASEKDYYNRCYTPIIDLTFPKDTYDSFSVWGYNSAGNQLTDFILELLNDGQVVYAEEFQIDQRIKSQSYATFSLGGNYLFDTARMTLLDNAFGRFENDGGDRVGFAEIAFYQEPYYFANSPDINADAWTIDGTTKKGVKLTDNGEQTATFAKPVTLNADGVIEVAEGKTLLLTGGISGNNELKKIGEGTLKIDTTEGPVDIKRLLVSTGRLDMKSYYKGSLEIGEKIEDGKYTTATFSPGNSVGTLEITGSFILNPGSTLLLEQDAGGMDQLTAESFVFEDGSFIELSMGAIAPGATYDIIALSDGTFTGDQLTEAYWTNLFKGGLPDYMILSLFGDSAVRLYVDPNAVPEPSTWALMVLGVVVLFLRKRVRN